LLPLAFVVTCGYLFYSSVTYAQSKNAIQVSFWVMGVGVIAWIAARLKKS
jgi:basic amino acid/polyamine antiporter, APA family